VNYDNSLYWQNMHRQFASQLQAVGHPWLSESFNRLKYQSEADSVLGVLSGLEQRWSDRKKLSMLDVGAGIGYWSELLSGWFAQRGFTVEVSALDISADALETVKKRNPHVQCINMDLKTIDSGCFENGYDLVLSFYCLHHLVNLKEFLNALSFLGRSVKPGGSVIIMDPILIKPFSKFDTFDFYSFTGNGVPRHLYLLDDVLIGEGLKRQAIAPAVSFLLNGNIEGYGYVSYGACKAVWRFLQVGYRSELLSKMCGGTLSWLDRRLKRLGLGFSSSLCLYEKSEVVVDR